MRVLIPVLFWTGLFGTVWEWWYAKKHGLAITRAEKVYLALALPGIFAVQLAVDLMGAPRAVVLPASALAMGMALSAWVIRRRVQRKTMRVNEGRAVGREPAAPRT